MPLLRFSLFLSIAIMMLGSSAACAQQPDITYRVGWGAPNEHYFDITMVVARHTDATLDVRIPAWRPGRYIMQNYAKDIIAFRAEDQAGLSLPFRKVDKDTWRIDKGRTDPVVIRYRSYANQLDGGASYVGESEAYLNPITALMNVPGRELEPVALILEKPAGWRVATALDYAGAAGGCLAEDYHELVDSPVLMSPDFELLSFEEGGATIELAIQGEWDVDEQTLIDHHRRIVRAQFDMMQDVPFDRYLFMYHIMPTPMGHGVEHKNSTSIVLGPAQALVIPDDLSSPTFYSALLSVASHEFFHLWNVERIRPAAMYPTDYSKENYTTQMWNFEGITDYYAGLFLLRAGLLTEATFLENLAATIRSFDTDPGRTVTSIAMSSFDSWAKQGAAPPNTFYSFYTAGKVMGLLLDLEVRARTDNRKSLDDVMRYMNETYAQQNRGVPENGFQQALETVTGTSFQMFFEDHIYSTLDIDYDRYLTHAGLRLDKQPDPNRRVALGITLDGNTITSVAPGSAAYHAGLDTDDLLVTLNESPVDNNLGALLQDFEPGDEVELGIVRRGKARTFTLALDAPPPLYVLTPLASPTSEQQQLRAAWLRQ